MKANGVPPASCGALLSPVASALMWYPGVTNISSLTHPLSGTMSIFTCDKRKVGEETVENRHFDMDGGNAE